MITLTQGNVKVTSGTYPNATVFECIADGNLIVTWHDGTTETIAFTAGQSDYIDAKSVEVSTGTFNIGYDNNNAYR